MGPNLSLTHCLLLGLSQMCSKICAQTAIWNFSKFSSIILIQCSHFACIMLLSWQQILQWSYLINECSIRVFHCKMTAIRKYWSIYSVFNLFMMLYNTSAEGLWDTRTYILFKDTWSAPMAVYFIKEYQA